MPIIVLLISLKEGLSDQAV